MQTVGAAWLMVSLGAGPMYVALIQTASALPFFVFALPAGAIGDIVDRRRLILYTDMLLGSAAAIPDVFMNSPSLQLTAHVGAMSLRCSREEQDFAPCTSFHCDVSLARVS